MAGFEGNIPYSDPLGILSYIKNPRYGESWVRREYSRARAVMVKRIERIEASGRLSLTTLPPKLKDISGAKELSMQLSKVYGFLDSKHGSLHGIKEMENKFIKTMQKTPGFKKIGASQLLEMREFMIFVKSHSTRKTPGSPRVMKAYQAAQRGRSLPKYMQKLYDEFRESRKV